MKKLLSILLAAILTVSMSACKENKSEVSSSTGSQTYVKVAKGYGGDVEVKVTIDAGVITDVELGENKESTVITERTLPLMKERIVQANTADVDVVTGATFTSFAIKKAVAEAMKDAGMQEVSVSMTDKKEYPEKTLETEKCDIVVVGGGPSGLAAAITAKQTNKDLNIIVIEKMDILSGNGKFDLNFYDVFNSEAQKANGVEDSKEKFIEDKRPQGDPEERLKVWAEGEEVIDAWLRSFNVTLDHNYGGRNHMATKDDYAGPMIQREMERLANELGIDIRTGTQGLDLIFDGKTVVGVKAKTNRNESYDIMAEKTIIATGGFSNNQELLEKYAPEYTGFYTSNQIGATGDFVEVFEKNKFKLENMGKIRVIPTILLPSRDITNNSKGTVLVNQDGKRFVNERNGELELANPIREQEKVFMIVDTQKVADHANVRKQVKEGRFAEFSTLDEVAKYIGCDAETLKETFKVYNENANNQKEDEFGLTPERAILEEGPYYVSQAVSAIHMTKGGVGCNEKAQVLYEDGTVVDGLYAAGEVTWQSGGYSQSVVFGRVAGEQAAKELSK